MQTIQLQVDDSSLGIVLTLVKNLKRDIIKDIKVIDHNVANPIPNNDRNNDRQHKLDQAKGILKNRIADPIQYQRALRDEWDRA